MESSWSYDSGDKTGFMNWGLKGSSYTYDHNTVFISSPLDTQSNLEAGFTDMVRKQSSHDSMRNCLSSNGSGGGDVIKLHRVASIAISGDEESSSNCRDSSLIDLKLGRFGDNLGYNAAIRVTAAPVLSCADSSTPAKRVKASILNSQIAICQVYGCNKDLSSSKDYHKRHKVCDVHSKTAKVIVNGIEQRFCQQCSRFHLLGEFDDGKRSCRRRLAGHNQRRRKPQVGLHSGRAGRLLHSYNGFGGARPNGTTMTATSFICQDILPDSQKSGLIDSSKHIKLENGADYGSKLESSWVDGQFMQKPVCPPYELIGRQCPYSEGLNTSAMTASVFNDNSFNQYHPQDSVSCSLFQNNLFDTASTVQGFPELSSKSGCALSLLSSQPRSSPDHHHHHHHQSSGIPTSSAHPLIMPGNGSNHNFGVSEDPFGISSLDLSNGVSCKYPSYDNTTTVGSAFSGGFLHGSEYVNVKGGPSYDDGATIDLLQLSTQLQRVERQRQAVSVKQEDDAFCCLKIT